MVSNRVLLAPHGRGPAGRARVASAGCSWLATAHADEAAVAPLPRRGLSHREPPAAPRSMSMTATEAAVCTACTPRLSRPRGPRADSSDIIKPERAQELHRQARRYALGHRFDVPQGPLVVAGGLVYQPQVANPHLIYPGDTLALAYGATAAADPPAAGGRRASRPAAAQLAAGWRDPDDPLLRDRRVPVTTDGADQRSSSKAAPYVLAFREEHVVGGTGHEIYVARSEGGSQRAASASCTSATSCAIRTTARSSATRASTPRRRWSPSPAIRRRPADRHGARDARGRQGHRDRHERAGQLHAARAAQATCMGASSTSSTAHSRSASTRSSSSTAASATASMRDTCWPWIRPAVSFVTSMRSDAE